MSIDPHQPFAGLHLLSAMVWPFDVEARRQGLVTFAANTLTEMEQSGPPRAIDWTREHFRAFAASTNAPVDKLMADPVVLAAIEEEAQSVLTKALSTLEGGVYRPAGGRPVLAKAPGSVAIMTELRTVARTRFKHVGRALCIFAAIERFHRDIPASLNRVWAVMEADAAAGRYPAPKDRARFMSLWSEWRCMAPLYAAQWLYLDVSVARGAPQEIGEAALSSPEGIAVLLGWAQWFRGWAVDFIPDRAPGPVIPDPEAVQLNTPVRPRPPLLEPLRPDQVAAAKGYKAPTDYRL